MHISPKGYSQLDAHVRYYRNFLDGWNCHIVNGLRVGGYAFQWFIGLTPRKD